MAYLLADRALGGPGCGSGCGCPSCRGSAGFGSYGEMYVPGPLAGVRIPRPTRRRTPIAGRTAPPLVLPLQPVVVPSPAPLAPAAAQPSGPALGALASRSTAPTVPNAIAIMKIISQFHGVPWRAGFTLLEHEGGVRLFRHHDGVMQTTRAARNSVIPRIPRPLKLALLGLAPSDATPEASLSRTLQTEFAHRLAVQIAAGVQELTENSLTGRKLVRADFCQFVSYLMRGWNLVPS